MNTKQPAPVNGWPFPASTVYQVKPLPKQRKPKPRTPDLPPATF